MSFAQIQADYILSAVPWTNNDSFENLIFEWLKLTHVHSCKKKKDFEKLFEIFRNRHFNKFLHQNTNSSEFVKLICDSVLTSKKDYEELFSKISAYKQVLEPMPGGHSGGVPVLVLSSLHQIQSNKIWYQDEVGHRAGVCCQCACTRKVTYVVVAEPECPANSLWLCSKCPVPNLDKTQYALPSSDEHDKMLEDMRELYTFFLSKKDSPSPSDSAWAQHYAVHNNAFDNCVTELKNSLVQTQCELKRVREGYWALQDWAEQVTATPSQLQQAYNDGQRSCQGYDLRFVR